MWDRDDFASDWLDSQADFPTDAMLINWQEANDYVNEYPAEEDEYIDAETPIFHDLDGDNFDELPF